MAQPNTETLLPNERVGSAVAADRIRQVAAKARIDVVGIAPVDRWDEFVPEGY